MHIKAEGGAFSRNDRVLANLGDVFAEICLNSIETTKRMIQYMSLAFVFSLPLSYLCGNLQAEVVPMAK